MNSRRMQYLQTRFDVHVDLGVVFFVKSQTRHAWLYGWMARMQFDKAVRHNPRRADEIASLYAARGHSGAAVYYFKARLTDPSCVRDWQAWEQLAGALQTHAQTAALTPPKRKRLEKQASEAQKKSAELQQPADRPATNRPPAVPSEIQNVATPIQEDAQAP